MVAVEKDDIGCHLLILTEVLLYLKCRYKDNRHVSMGAEKWLDIELWDNIRECFGILKARGYRIATAHLGADAVQTNLSLYFLICMYLPYCMEVL